MKRAILVLGCLLTLALLVGCSGPARPPAPTPTPEPSGPTLQWLGHSTFILSTRDTTILMDPMPLDMGYSLSHMSGVRTVTVSHEHRDHNNIDLAVGSPLVLRGLEGDGWAKIDQVESKVRVRTVASYHDDAQGSKRGKNTIFLFDADGLRIAHLGDLGQVLTPEQVAEIGPVDVLLVPVGGFYTIDAAQATQVVEQLKPWMVIPMHYKTPRLSKDWPGQGVEPFLEGKTVQRPGTNVIVPDRKFFPAETTVVVLSY